MLEKTLESPLDSKEIKQLILKAVNCEYLLKGLIDAEAPILFPHDAKSQLIGKDPYFRKDWGQEEKEETEHKMVRWYHWLNGYESNSWRWWRTGKPGVLQSMGSQKSDMVKQLKNKLLFLNISNFSYCIIMVTNFQPDISKEIPYFFPQTIFLRSRITQTKIIDI